MAGYNAEYTRTTKNFVFLDAKKATIADNKSITWGPYKLQKVTAKGAPGGAKAPARKKKAALQKEAQSIDDAAKELTQIAEFLADDKNTNPTTLQSKRGEFTKKHKAAQRIDGFDNEYTVVAARYTIKAKTAPGVGQSSSSFGAEVKQYNFACWFYTGPEKEGHAASLEEIKKLAAEEIGAGLQLDYHGTITTLTHNATSRCFHESLVAQSAFGGGSKHDGEEAEVVVGLKDGGYETDAAEDDGEDDDVATPSAAEPNKDTSLVLESVVSPAPADGDDKEASAASGLVAQTKAEAEAEAGDEAEVPAPKKKKKGGVEKAAPKAAAEAVVHVNVDVDFAGFDTFNPKCMIAYMQGQPQGQPAGPSNHVFYTIKAVSANAGQGLVPGPVKPVSANAGLVAGAGVVTDSSEAQKSGVAPPLKHKAKKEPVELDLNAHVTFTDVVKFWRRAYVPAVLCEVLVTDAMEYLFSRIYEDDAKPTIGYYNGVTIIQTLMMGNVTYMPDASGANAVSVGMYTEKEAAGVADIASGSGHVTVAGPGNPIGFGFGFGFGFGIDHLVTALQSIVVSGKTSREIADAIYAIPVGNYAISRDVLSAKVLAIKGAKRTTTLNVKKEEKPVVATRTYMYARYVGNESQILVYMTRPDVPKTPVVCTVKYAVDTPAGSISILSAKFTTTGVTVTMSDNRQVNANLAHADVKRSLRLVKDSNVMNDTWSGFKVACPWRLGVPSDVEEDRAQRIAKAWRPPSSAKTPLAPPNANVEGFGRARPRARGISGMSRFV